MRPEAAVHVSRCIRTSLSAIPAFVSRWMLFAPRARAYLRLALMRLHPHPPHDICDLVADLLLIDMPIPMKRCGAYVAARMGHATVCRQRYHNDEGVEAH